MMILWGYVIEIKGRECVSICSETSTQSHFHTPFGSFSTKYPLPLPCGPSASPRIFVSAFAYPPRATNANHPPFYLILAHAPPNDPPVAVAPPLIRPPTRLQADRLLFLGGCGGTFEGRASVVIGGGRFVVAVVGEDYHFKEALGGFGFSEEEGVFLRAMHGNKKNKYYWLPISHSSEAASESLVAQVVLQCMGLWVQKLLVVYFTRERGYYLVVMFDYLREVIYSDKLFDNQVLGKVSCGAFNEALSACKVANRKSTNDYCLELRQLTDKCYRSKSVVEANQWIMQEFKEALMLMRFLEKRKSSLPQKLQGNSWAIFTNRRNLDKFQSLGRNGG